MLMATITLCGIQTEILQLALAAVASKVWRHALTRVYSRTSLVANGIGTAFATAWQFAIVDFFTVTNRTSTRISSVAATVICSGPCNNTCCVVNMAATIVLQTRIDGCAYARGGIAIEAFFASTFIAVRACPQAVFIHATSSIVIFAAIDRHALFTTARITLIAAARSHGRACLGAASMSVTVTIALAAEINLVARFSIAFVSSIAPALIPAWTSHVAAGVTTAAMQITMLTIIDWHTACAVT